MAESSVTSGNPESTPSLAFWMPCWQLLLMLLGQLKSACSLGYFQPSTNGLCHLQAKPCTPALLLRTLLVVISSHFMKGFACPRQS